MSLSDAEYMRNLQSEVDYQLRKRQELMGEHEQLRQNVRAIKYYVDEEIGAMIDEALGRRMSRSDEMRSRGYLEHIAFDQPTVDWLAQRNDYEIAAIHAFVIAHEKPLENDCSDGPNIVLDAPGAYDRMYESEYSCCGWATSRLKLDEWDCYLIVGSCHGH